jgi:hypothetical protein
MSSLSALKKKTSLDKLTKELGKLKTGGGSKDERFWQPEVDKAGNGYAIIRFLDTPFVDGEEGMPWIQVFNHGFQGPGGWFIENCLTSIGQACPVCEQNGKHWNSGVESDKDIARKQKRKLSYISNILVIKDSEHPENEGKVFLYRFGKKIFEKIKEQIEPQFEDETPLNPFNFWEGANLKLKIRNVDGYRNYDKSEFDRMSAISEDDDEIEKIWKQSYSLKEFLDAKEFKSYDFLQKKLSQVLGNVVASRTIEEDSGDDEPSVSYTTNSPSNSFSGNSNGDEDEDTLSFFKKLAQE